MKKSNKIILFFIPISLMTTSPIFAASHNEMKMKDTNKNSVIEKVTEQASDIAITAQIKAKILKSVLLKVFEINVTTKDGVVHLSGTVNSDMQYEKVISLVESTDGVKEVNVDKLQVKENHTPLKDLYITAKIKGSLIKAKLMGEDVQVMPINVETKNGIVYLSGNVDNDQQKCHIIDLAKSIKGVSEVKSDITLKQE